MNKQILDRISIGLLVLSLVIYVTCFSYSGAEFQKVCGRDHVTWLWQVPHGELTTMSSVMILLMGWMGILTADVGVLGWFANPLYLYALKTAYANKSISTSRQYATWALLLAFVSLPLTNVFPFAADEGVVCRFSATRPEIGYWLWLLSITLLYFASSLGNLVAWNRQPNRFDAIRGKLLQFTSLILGKVFVFRKFITNKSPIDLFGGIVILFFLLIIPVWLLGTIFKSVIDDPALKSIVVGALVLFIWLKLRKR